METLILVVVLATAAAGSPRGPSDVVLLRDTKTDGHIVHKRFINPLFSYGGTVNEALPKIRTKRSDACEQLHLCRLHARSGTDFLAAFQLYFVNKENAKQWDHHARSSADCNRRYSDCYYK